MTLRRLASVLTAFLFIASFRSEVIAQTPSFNIDTTRTVVDSNAVVQSANPFVFDRTGSSITGAEDIASMENILVQYEQQAIPQRLFPEDDRLSKFVGRLYRFAKTIVLENVQDMLADLIQHEVFGHGARAREFGDDHVTYELHLYPPYGTGAGVTYSEIGSSRDRHSSLSIAGIEAENILAQEVRLRSLETGFINYRDANLYFVGRLALTQYALTTHDLQSAITGNDIASYIIFVGERNPKVTLANIRANSLLNFADPLTLAWFYQYFYSYLFCGDVETPMPMIHVGGIQYLPGFRVALTPFGYDYYLENMLVHDHKVFIVSLGMGTADHGTSATLKMEAPNAWSNPLWTVGIDFDAWRQPPLDLSSNLFLPVTSAWSYGALATAHIGYHLTSTFELAMQGGYKTQGFVEGEALGSGPVIRAGIELR
ncbi:MAG TPA: hypothetical protein VG537_03180 [Candidatus Kapabacteria bacterium]|jgi:hypothetical protein|nr:hypothetical protein [Candidatus Kapabacteria bacterium]